MKRPSIFLFTSAILAVSLLAAGGLASATMAQGASPMPTAESPVVGTWLLVMEGTAPTVVIFHADGTYMEVEGSGVAAGSAGVAAGSWEPTGPNTGALSYSYYAVDENGAVTSTKLRSTLEVAADGKSLTAVYTIEFIGPDGTPSGQMGPGTATLTRIAVEPMGSPVAPLPQMGPTASTAP